MRGNLRSLSAAALLEGTSFMVLIGVAAPLKHIVGYAPFASVMGPVHGVAFLFYWWLLVRTATAYSWSPKATAWAALAALLPLGGWLVAWRMRMRMRTTA
jgi:integral membrane protein